MMKDEYRRSLSETDFNFHLSPPPDDGSNNEPSGLQKLWIDQYEALLENWRKKIAEAKAMTKKWNEERDQVIKKAANYEELLALSRNLPKKATTKDKDSTYNEEDFIKLAEEKQKARERLRNLIESSGIDGNRISTMDRKYSKELKDIFQTPLTSDQQRLEIVPKKNVPDEIIKLSIRDGTSRTHWTTYNPPYAGLTEIIDLNGEYGQISSNASEYFGKVGHYLGYTNTDPGNDDYF